MFLSATVYQLACFGAHCIEAAHTFFVLFLLGWLDPVDFILTKEYIYYLFSNSKRVF